MLLSTLLGLQTAPLHKNPVHIPIPVRILGALMLFVDPQIASWDDPLPPFRRNRCVTRSENGQRQAVLDSAR